MRQTQKVKDHRNTLARRIPGIPPGQQAAFLDWLDNYLKYRELTKTQPSQEIEAKIDSGEI